MKYFNKWAARLGLSNPMSLANTVSGEEGYYQSSTSWYKDKYELATLSRHRYRLLAIGLGFLLGVSLIAFIAILPLKQYVYRLIEVNQTSGEVLTLKEVEGRQYAEDWVVTRYFISQYVMNRHMYSREDLTRTYNLTLAMSAKPIAEAYAEATKIDNPTSPLNVLNTEYYREVKIKGINQLNDKTALVRYQVITHHKSMQQDTKTEDFQSVVKWAFNTAPTTQEDHDKNPLGFFVTHYQVSPVYTDKND